MLTAGWEFDGSGAAEGRRVVILVPVGTLMTMASASRLMWIQSTLLLPAPVKRSSAAQMATAMALEPPMPAPAGASESVVSVKPPCGWKNLVIFGEEREAIALGFHRGGERGKTLFALDVAGNQLDAVVASGMRFDDARGVKRNCGVHGNRTRMNR